MFIQAVLTEKPHHFRKLFGLAMTALADVLLAHPTAEINPSLTPTTSIENYTHALASVSENSTFN